MVVMGEKVEMLCEVLWFRCCCRIKSNLLNRYNSQLNWGLHSGDVDFNLRSMYFSVQLQLWIVILDEKIFFTMSNWLPLLIGCNIYSLDDGSAEML